MLSILATMSFAACGGAPPQGTGPSPAASATVQPTAVATPATSPIGGTPAPTGQPEPTPAAGTPAAVALPDLARIAAGETPAGWKEVQTADGGCRMAVPPDWDTETMSGTAIAPGFAGQASVSNDPLANWGSWEAYISTVKTAFFGPDRLVLVETDELFVMAAGPSSGDASVLVGRNRGESVCGILLIITGNAIADLLDTGHQILYSLGATD